MQLTVTTRTFIPPSLSLLLILTHSCVCAQIRSFSDSTQPAAADGNADTIPMEFYQELDNVTDVSDFIERFVDKDSIDPQLGIQGNLRMNVERAAAEIPRPAVCMPDNQIIPLTPLNPSKDPRIFYIPKCTRVKRCSGCCNSELMSCQPVERKLTNFEVTKYEYNFGDRRPHLLGKEIIPVEQHTRCKCDCRIKKEDCNSYQTYSHELCRCKCNNEDALSKCLELDHKIWDEQSCKCICRESHPCTTGTIFDESECRCVDPSLQGFSRNGTLSLEDRRRFIIKAIPVDPSETTRYRV